MFNLLVLGSNPNRPTQNFIIMVLFPAIFYLKEFSWRVFYFTISVFISFVIIINFIEYFIFLGVYPLFKLLHLKLIITYVTQILSSVLQVTIYLSCIFNLPFLAYNVVAFLTNSLYRYQLIIIKYYLFVILVIWFFSFLVTYNIIISLLLNFFLYSEAVQKTITLYAAVKLQFQIYLSWVLYITNIISFLFNSITFLAFFVIVYVNPIRLFVTLKSSKRYVTFLFIVLNTTAFPLDLLIQLFASILIYFSMEFIFFVSCFLIKS
uniref:SecY-independent transporter protein n=1 Tax=Thorea hispida TaxID=202687 RepID=A0A1Z1XB00_9FLOR|nr:SecY-independent transporter protein [Thorea hispida]ARX95957.1 SecY-independent transporter protein [Thorea hispida]